MEALTRMAPKRNMLVTFLVAATEELELGRRWDRVSSRGCPSCPEILSARYHQSVPRTLCCGHKSGRLLRGMEIELLLATFVHAFHNAKN
jgi:hypothetical protein